MKYEVIETPSTQNVVKMLFECKTFDERSVESSKRNLEAIIKVGNEKIDFVGYSSTAGES
tara:strand:- start:920 stop:1099 length:180 start_codon:yes stop_codon:yes gene_type:complete